MTNAQKNKELKQVLRNGYPELYDKLHTTVVDGEEYICLKFFQLGEEASLSAFFLPDQNMIMFRPMPGVSELGDNMTEKLQQNIDDINDTFIERMDDDGYAACMFGISDDSIVAQGPVKLVGQDLKIGYDYFDAEDLAHVAKCMYLGLEEILGFISENAGQ